LLLALPVLHCVCRQACQYSIVSASVASAAQAIDLPGKYSAAVPAVPLLVPVEFARGSRHTFAPVLPAHSSACRMRISLGDPHAKAHISSKQGQHLSYC